MGCRKVVGVMSGAMSTGNYFALSPNSYQNKKIALFEEFALNSMILL